MKRQTAVEWLEGQLRKRYGSPSLYKLVNQAKEMEKEQILEARMNGFIISGEGYNAEYPFEGCSRSYISDEIRNEQYYNETYKNTEE